MLVLHNVSTPESARFTPHCQKCIVLRIMFTTEISVYQNSRLGDFIEKITRSGRYGKGHFGWVSYHSKKYKVLGTGDDLFILVP